MAESHASHIQLLDVLSFNEKLIAISRAGIPLAFIPNPQQIEQTLQDWSGSVAMQVGRGESVETALDNTGVSDQYRRALRHYVVSGGSIEAAQCLVDGGSWSDRNRTQFSISLLGTWIVWVLACIAWLGLVGIITPSLRSHYEMSRVKPGPAFAWLNFFYAYGWWWMVGLVALTLVAPLLWTIVSQRSHWSWLPFRRRFLLPSLPFSICCYERDTHTMILNYNFFLFLFFFVLLSSSTCVCVCVRVCMCVCVY